MYKGLRIYRNKYCEAAFLALPRIAYIMFNRPVMAKTILLRHNSQQTH